ncbi:SNARE associated Golgi protein [Haladaptatus litoreus]|uniref:SNARE associated Golgi protein n=1 Tax=Haladaptatus litoreus TaxID=553468 RepID=A0A1N7BYV7_9EURY|nr:SNARE associated Golgi protein [Haladaptatus litoreus]
MQIASLVAVETTPFVGLFALSMFGLALLSFGSGSNSLRKFLSDYGIIFLVAGVAVAAVIGIYLFLTGDEELAKQWLDQYGLIALFLILILEGAMLLYFAPSESLVPFSVTVLASPDNIQAIAVIIFVAVIGATIGQYALFSLAKRGGREYLLEKPWFRISEDSLDRFDGWFDRWGRIVVPVSNALLFTRGMLTVPAGFAEMKDWEFIVLSAIGTLIFQSWLAAFAIYTIELGLLDFLPF